MQEGTSQSWQVEQALSSGVAILPEEIEEQLQRILASPTFHKAPRHSRFLSFVVRKALSGEAESVKEYLIGLEVFDRPSDYDPGSDPIVRAEARRLRSRLADYYKKTGSHDRIQIDLPKGTYVPTFSRNHGKIVVLPGGELVEKEPASPRWRRWGFWGLAGALLCVGAGYWLYVVRGGGRPSALSPRLPANVLVLAEFTNTTGEAVFDGTLRQGLSSQLEQSPFLNLLSDQRIAQTLSLMAQPKGTRLTREMAYEVCQRSGSSAAVEGSISSLGTQYVLGLTAVSCSDGKLLAEEQVTADRKEHVLKALGHAATKLRQKLGESRDSIQKYDVAPEGVTTASVEALQAYSLGHQAMLRNDYSSAISQFQRAISLDPNFAMAYALSGTIYENESQTVLAAENTRQAYKLRDRVSEREKFYIDAHYYNLVTGNLEAAGKTYELWAQTYPQEGAPFANMGVTYAVLGDYDKSLAGYQQDLKLDPGSALSFANLIYGYLSVNRLDEARATAQQARDLHIDSPLIHAYLYYLDFLRHDRAAMEEESKQLMGKPGWEDSMLYFEADTAAYGGQFAKARELIRRATDSAVHADEKETAATYQGISAVHDALVGNADQARDQLQAALTLSHGKDVEAVSAIALAMIGDVEQARRLADKLNKRFPEDTTMQFNYLPTIRAAAALRKGDAEKAVEVLAPAQPYELGRGPLVWLYPIYLRGVAYLAAGQGTAAAAEFQTILNHPGVVVNEPVGALAKLGLGRAYALSGDTGKAKIAYQDFLSLWKDADPEIPILTQAKAEYTKLQ